MLLPGLFSKDGNDDDVDGNDDPMVEDDYSSGAWVYAFIVLLALLCCSCIWLTLVAARKRRRMRNDNEAVVLGQSHLGVIRAVSLDMTNAAYVYQLA